MSVVLSGEFDHFTNDLVSPLYGDDEPTTAHALLAHLHLDNAPRWEQTEATCAWLREHPPVSAMTYALEGNGFGDRPIPARSREASPFGEWRKLDQ